MNEFQDAMEAVGIIAVAFTFFGLYVVALLHLVRWLSK